MHTAPLPITAAFVTLVAIVAASFVFATARAGVGVEPSATTRRYTITALALIVGVMAVSGLLAARGLLRDFDAVPPALLRVVFPATVLSFVVAFSPFGGRLARGLPIAGLVGFQVFRVAVELILWSLHRASLVPVQMTFEGLNFDVLTGLTAPLVAWLAWRGRLKPTFLLVWNVAGLALLANIVAISLLSAPGPLQRFHTLPANRIVAEAPYIWLPVVLVQAALFGHLLVFRRLRFGLQSPAKSTETRSASTRAGTPQ